MIALCDSWITSCVFDMTLDRVLYKMKNIKLNINQFADKYSRVKFILRIVTAWIYIDEITVSHGCIQTS